MTTWWAQESTLLPTNGIVHTRSKVFVGKLLRPRFWFASRRVLVARFIYPKRRGIDGQSNHSRPTSLRVGLSTTVVTVNWPLGKQSSVTATQLRATSHMSQEPWPCNGEDHLLSSKGRTMCVGKAVLCSHGPSSIVWSENGPCCGTIAYFIGEKRGEDFI